MVTFRCYPYEEAQQHLINEECEMVNEMMKGLSINEEQIISSTTRQMLKKCGCPDNLPDDKDYDFFAKVAKKLLDEHLCIHGKLYDLKKQMHQKQVEIIKKSIKL